MSSSVDPTAWVLDRIIDNFKSADNVRNRSIAALEEVVQTVNGTSPDGLLFGMVSSLIDKAKSQQIISLAEDAISSWNK